MNCQEFWDRMPELSSQLLRDEAEHLKQCPECTGNWQRQRVLESGIRHLSEDLRRVEAPARVQASLVAAFRAQQARRPHVMPSRSAWMPLVSGIAAALLMATGLLLVHDRPTLPVRHTAAGAVELASLPAASDVADDDSPDSDGFIPLPNAERIAPDENVNVVRVEVPRSAMLAVGLPVSADQSRDLVEADIKMGQDGLARAVRFVNE